MRLIASDLDGTLLNSNHEISEENIKAIKNAQKKGIEVVISTGRGYFDVLEILKKAQLSTYVISDNGASIHSNEGKLISSISMDKTDIEKIIKWLNDSKFYYEVFTDKAIYCPEYARKILTEEIKEFKSTNPTVDVADLQKSAEMQYSQTGFVFKENYQEILDCEEEFYSILGFSFDEKKRKTGVNYFSELKHLSIVSSANHNFEILNKKASKGNALENLSNLLNIPLDQTVAIGDNYNDVSMLQKAKLGVAMENAPEDVKNIANLITNSNDNHGVAKIINQYI